ncbi:dienelactone hydrolase [Trichoderma austrokoningii]
MASHPPGSCCTIETLHMYPNTLLVRSKSKFLKIDGGIGAYLTTPSEENAHKGSDSFAAKEYTTLIPDVFNGDAIPLNKFPTVDLLSWIANGFDGKSPHTAEFVNPIYLYVIRHFKSDIEAAFIQEDELAVLAGLLSISAAKQTRFPAAQRHKSKEILIHKLAKERPFDQASLG